jgi:hypothetical protein
MGDGRLPLIDPETHATVPGRYCGRDRTHAPLPDGEIVPAISYYHAAISSGDLALAEEPTPEPSHVDNQPVKE